jgi:hypothetical protein
MSLLRGVHHDRNVYLIKYFRRAANHIEMTECKGIKASRENAYFHNNLHSAALAAAQIFYEFARVACDREWARDPFARVNSGVKQWTSIIAD